MNAIASVTDTTLADTLGHWYTWRQDVNANRCLMQEKTLKAENTLLKSETKSCRTDFHTSVDLNEKQRIVIDSKDTKIKRLKMAVGVLGGLVFVVAILGLT